MEANGNQVFSLAVNEQLRVSPPMWAKAFTFSGEPLPAPATVSTVGIPFIEPEQLEFWEQVQERFVEVLRKIKTKGMQYPESSPLVGNV